MTPVLTLAQILDLADPFGEFKTGDAQGDKRVQYARAIEKAVLESIVNTIGSEDNSLPADSTEDDHFMVEAAMHHGFVPIDNDGDVFVCTSQQVVALMQAAEQQGRVNSANDDGYVQAAWMHPNGGVIHEPSTGLERNTFTIPLFMRTSVSQKGEWIAADDYYRNVKDLDIALNGDGAAQRPSLIDVLAQVEQLRRELGKPILEVVKQPMVWIEGQPPHPWDDEWFLAELINGERVVLKALPNGGPFEYTTSDHTFYLGKLIKRWMQLPDSEYVPAIGPTNRVPQQWVEYVTEIVQSAEGYQRRTGDTVNGGWVERGRALLDSAKSNPQ